MTTTRSSDQTGHLRVLGGQAPNAPQGAPGPNLLEAFPNQFPQRDYIIRISFPEFTSLCPVTGQPDFAEIIAEYIPEALCVESKSFKLYMFAYRSHQSFMETITNSVLEHLVATLNPRWCRVQGLFTPRGATLMHVFAEHFAPLPADRAASLRETVNAWKRERR